MKEQTLSLTTEFIKLDSLLKFAGLCGSGGEAKERIQAGELSVNGTVCTARGKKLRSGDIVSMGDETVRIL